MAQAHERTEYFLQGISDVSAERIRQIEEENYGAISDDTLNPGELGAAAACYAIHAAWSLAKSGTRETLSGVPAWWPFHADQWKPEDVRRNLVKAAALVIAEIDKFDRKQARESKEKKTDE